MNFAAHITRDIAEDLITPRCPGCNSQVADFDGCCALLCQCGCNFCGWCLEPFKMASATHTHVRECAYNPPSNRGNLYPPPPHPQEWLKVMYEWARKRICERIAKIEARFQEPVHTQLKLQYPEVQLPYFGTVVAHGFRPKQERCISRTYEDNITTLLQMGLANRERALFVLDAVGGRLQDAVDLLLAAKGHNANA